MPALTNIQMEQYAQNIIKVCLRQKHIATCIRKRRSGRISRLIVSSVGHCPESRQRLCPASRQASSNYGIGLDGAVGMYVEECNRSWCSSSNANDQRAVTIECASDTTAPYAFRQVVYDRLIELCVDICKRNGQDQADLDRQQGQRPCIRAQVRRDAA